MKQNGKQLKEKNKLAKKELTGGQKALKIITIVMSILTAIDYLIIDIVPFIDEALFTLITGILICVQAYLKNKCN